MAMLAALQQEMQKIKAEDALLREASISQKGEDDGGDEHGENHEDEEASAAKEAPESHFLTPQRPGTWTAESPWTEKVWLEAGLEPRS